MKGDKYIYEGKTFELEGKYYDDYVKTTGVAVNKVYTKEEASKIINANVIAVYRNQNMFHCTTEWTGHEICDYLSTVREEIEIRIDVTCAEEEL